MQPLRQRVKQVRRREALRPPPKRPQARDQFVCVAARTQKRQLALRLLQRIPQRRLGPRHPFAQPHQVGRLQSPRRRRQHPRAGNVVPRLHQQPQVGQQVAHQRVIQNRKIANHIRNAALIQRLDQFLAMVVNAVEHGEAAPALSGAV